MERTTRRLELIAEKFATLRLNYPLMVADAGPCGLWPDDLGPSYDTKHFENRQYYNFGCATQRIDVGGLRDQPPPSKFVKNVFAHDLKYSRTSDCERIQAR